jgi:hypothetical protein
VGFGTFGLLVLLRSSFLVPKVGSPALSIGENAEEYARLWRIGLGLLEFCVLGRVRIVQLLKILHWILRSRSVYPNLAWGNHFCLRNEANKEFWQNACRAVSAQYERPPGEVVHRRVPVWVVDNTCAARPKLGTSSIRCSVLRRWPSQAALSSKCDTTKTA